MDKIKIISKECKFSNWLNVYVEKVLLPNNKEVERDIIEKGDAVGIVALNDNNELLYRYRKRFTANWRTVIA